MGHVMRKPVYAICEQQRCRSACASVQSDQQLCCLLPRWYNTSSFYIQNFEPLPSFCGCTDRFVSYLVANPKDRFSLDEAQISSIPVVPRAKGQVATSGPVRCQFTNFERALQCHNVKCKQFYRFWSHHGLMFFFFGVTCHYNSTALQKQLFLKLLQF